MVFAAIAGILIGALSVVPLGVAAKKVRKSDAFGALDMLAPFVLTMLVSFVVLIGGLLVVRFTFPDVTLYFAIAEFLAFVIGVIAFGMYVSKRL